jgi:hypothetical protein
MQLTKKQRIILITHLPHTESFFSTYRIYDSSIPVSVLDSTYYITEPDKLAVTDDNVYLFPVLLEEDGTPWYLGNLYLLSLATSRIQGVGYTDTKDIRRKASLLLDYKLFCENSKDRNGDPCPIDLFDFKHKLKSRRPTWRYFSHLMHEENTNPNLLNAKTGVVYSFYKFAANQPDIDLDLEMVETLTSFAFYKQTEFGSYLIEGEKRSQTVKIPEPAPVDIGYVRDEGEDLRPLFTSELNALISALNTNVFDIDEKLIHFFALTTGERKQTILTLRQKHLKQFNILNLNKQKDAYKLKLSALDGCDTKFDTPHTLLVPTWVANGLITWDSSSKAKERREKFKSRFGKDTFNDRDMYVFLSSKGDCRYMSQRDPRYRKTISPANGQITRNLKEKLLNAVGNEITSDYTFHWLRATFALALYKQCQHLVSIGKMKPGSELNYIRQRLHHRNTSTTEHYLKLFSSVSELMKAQEYFEDSLLGDLFGSELGKDFR